MSKIMKDISPLPWYLSGVRGRFPQGPALTIASECDGRGYAYVPYSDRRPGDHESAYSDANYIVNACNLYPELVRLLVRYRNETPLGNQPHMIAHEVDEILAKCKAGET